MENRGMRINMNKTKVMINGECQKLIQQEAQLNARGGRPYCPQSHKYNHAVRI